MSMWLGADGAQETRGLPHVTKIQRKPRGIGSELKNLADVDSRVMLKLEIQKGKEIQRTLEYTKNHNAGTALTLRLTKAYHESGRRVIGDSAFGSVPCALALRNVGLHLNAKVK